MITLHEVVKSYHSSRGRTPVINGVSLSVEAGHSLAIMGRSGSGKTTLLSLIGGLERPDSGTVACFGYPVHALEGRKLSAYLRRHVGFLFQFGNLLSALTVAENVALPLRLNNATQAVCAKRVGELLHRIGLAEAARAFPSELSGGEMQRVAFARAIAHRPPLLLADEPTSSLDSATATTLMDLMFRVGREEGRITVVATHDSEVSALADRVLRMQDGRNMDATAPV